MKGRDQGIKVDRKKNAGNNNSSIQPLLFFVHAKARIQEKL
jgi:hypothetical protein